MAIFEKEEQEHKSFIVLLDKSGENVVAYVNPVKGIDQDTLVNSMTVKGLNVEVRESKPALTDFEL